LGAPLTHTDSIYEKDMNLGDILHMEPLSHGECCRLLRRKEDSVLQRSFYSNGDSKWAM
jgi:hypothetical protein